ncbi:MAG: UDP-glucose 6-dehydrogenase [Candidatus Kerfeldbacteria bacterium CG15_BIG_FIL_POST_REV_8_21_14_020_45_12]|uniref:UDP-glucose 6-dehydrogenase n=1 Tax=Candidatus Kerfeldbacteria bacterium CG15_BIG_FIL_POST_REV_8_21_14_020_45_12 TaxID=2014247 RepID=A0A2M7H3J1_9BACT|nr:MAG: UDP-glucose 6-dehydrogenase [Candidatus Kerfeldbacteria bacterium CG15_BIG_FIL_POST_REV_8_21_14_020_45_12]PJA93820.1 MAG: UDP-glucose 6-dehydrogenase [Candidatus Kerfeldbacteria bacterium CG_4_9_14_3_um_filter_45_8]
MNITVVGTGYVGLVSGTCLAEIGHSVTCVDIDEDKIKRLEKGEIPIFEPGLDALVLSNVRVGRLKFTTSLPDVIDKTDVIVIAVGTPSRPDGHADLQYVYAVAEQIGQNLKKYTAIVNKSTVPVGTGKEVEDIIRKNYSGEFSVVSCPEFLREGSAVEDFMKPDRVVIGARDDRAAQVLLEVFKGIRGEKLVTTVESAELIKYASNAFLATKISFINEIAQICERAGADIEEVAYGIGLDSRIGPRFLKAGIGWGGSCFPKDVEALDQMAGMYGYDFKLLSAVIEVNNDQRKHFVAKVMEHFEGKLTGKKIAILGLAFKGNTDDIRESAAVDIVRMFAENGADVSAFDYEATKNAQRALEGVAVRYAEDPYDCVNGADVVVIATEWPQFIELDWAKVARLVANPVIFDGRNLFQPERMREHGLTYISIGRNGEFGDQKS